MIRWWCPSRGFSRLFSGRTTSRPNIIIEREFSPFPHRKLCNQLLGWISSRFSFSPSASLAKVSSKNRCKFSTLALLSGCFREEVIVILSSADSCRNIYIYMLDTYWRNELIRRKHDNDKDAGRKTQEEFFNNILPLTLFIRFRKGCSRAACKRELETEHKL